ncbi:hypothetical protein FCL54_14720 [Pseudalkalibacillus caeni]|uniref:Uncharacterized protein n=2 Tax=Exobacillus caeni TaxID=2574798 RepID=A0A5R9F1V1_9BACL|nr:hypothetical protein FCL54_14720 [Pseudalkalibacillus caeni]
MKGFKEFEKELETLQKKADELDGDHEVPFKELFPEDFMREYTKFSSINEMVDKSQWTVENDEDFSKIPDDEWDKYVKETTNFENWEEMQGTAVEVWGFRQLGF